jgi:hypothetical protein
MSWKRDSKRYALWKDWCKHCTNSRFYKLLVLIGLAHSPTFEMHYEVMEKIESLSSEFKYYKYSVQDGQNRKPTSVNWGWYAVYILTLLVNSVVCALDGFDILTWQYWAHVALLILCFVSGTSYRKGE